MKVYDTNDNLIAVSINQAVKVMKIAEATLKKGLTPHPTIPKAAVYSKPPRKQIANNWRYKIVDADGVVLANSVEEMYDKTRYDIPDIMDWLQETGDDSVWLWTGPIEPNRFPRRWILTNKEDEEELNEEND